jgi:hypothetical protein
VYVHEVTRIIQNNITDPTSNAIVARNAERFSMEEAVRIQTQDVRIQTTGAARRYATAGSSAIAKEQSVLVSQRPRNEHNACDSR